MSLFVEASVAPAESRACTVSRLKPGDRVWVFVQVCCAALKAASSPFTTTRVELAIVLVPLRSRMFVFTIAKKAPPTGEESPSTDKSAIR
jgi:hypothetical protein